MAPKFENNLVSVLRRPDGLFAYLIERGEEYCIPLLTQHDVEKPLELADPFLERLVPLRELALARRDPLKSALASWDKLGHVEQLEGTPSFM